MRPATAPSGILASSTRGGFAAQLAAGMSTPITAAIIVTCFIAVSWRSCRAPMTAGKRGRLKAQRPTVTRLSRPDPVDVAVTVPAPSAGHSFVLLGLGADPPQPVPEVPCRDRSRRRPAADAGCKGRNNQLEAAQQLDRALEIADIDGAEHPQQRASFMRARRTLLPVDTIDGGFEALVNALVGKALFHG